MGRHASYRIWNRAARTAEAGALEEDYFPSGCKGVGNRWVPIVHVAREMLKA